MSDVAIPTAVLGGPQSTDLLAPLKELLQGLEVLPEDSAVGEKPGILGGTPQSVAVVKAGALALTKGWAVAAGALGGGGAIVSAIAGFYSAQATPIRIVLLGGSAVVLSVALAAVAVMVSADISSRTAAVISVHETRKAITLEFLQRAYSASERASTPRDDGNPLVVALAAAGSKAAVTCTSTASPEAGHLCGLRQVNGQVQVYFQRSSDAKGDWVAPTDLTLDEFEFGSP